MYFKISNLTETLLKFKKMPLPIINSIASWIMKKRIHQMELFLLYPMDVQKEVLFGLTKKAANTEWGKKYDFKSISSIKDFQERVPISTYEQLYRYLIVDMRLLLLLLFPGCSQQKNRHWQRKVKVVPIDSSCFQ